MTRTVVGDVAAALDLEDGDIPGSQQVLCVASAPEREHVRVLDQDERVGDRFGLSCGHELLLQSPGLLERAKARVEDARGRRGV